MVFILPFIDAGIKLLTKCKKNVIFFTMKTKKIFKPNLNTIKSNVLRVG